ncbi:MAG: RluA family pseudouridine synthase [bacterium]
MVKNVTSEQFLVQDEKRIRLDLFLKEQMPCFSRSFIQSLIGKGKVFVNKEVSKQAYLVGKGDRIEVNIPSSKQLIPTPEPIPLDILWEDSSLLVVNKSAGMLVHPVSSGQGGTLVNALLAHCDRLSKVGGILRQGIVHRLDKDTSGVMVVAKDDPTHLALAAQFRKRIVRKTYLALVRGKPSPSEGTIEAKIGRSPKAGKKMTIKGRYSREAVTTYRMLRQWKNWSLLEIHPLTGRTHQIRLHLRFINCFLVGDDLYGAGKGKDFLYKLKRAMLHAKSLGFFHPRKENWVEFEAPLPQDMNDAIKRLEDQ